jgi:hypothetical protein
MKMTRDLVAIGLAWAALALCIAFPWLFLVALAIGALTLSKRLRAIITRSPHPPGEPTP